MNKFVIICAARSGSTMLRHLLDDHPKINCEGEVFVTRGVIRFFSLDRRGFRLSQDYHNYQTLFKSLNTSALLDKHILSVDDKNIQSVGFKFKTDEFFLPAFSEISSYIERDESLKIIHLKRKDLLAQYISYLNVHRNSGPTALFDPEQSKSKYDKLLVDILHLERYLEVQLFREKEIRVRLGNHSILETWYKDIIDAATNTLDHIQEFLGVPTRSLNTKTVKIIKNPYDLIINMEEVYNMFNASIYSDRFYPQNVV